MIPDNCQLNMKTKTFLLQKCSSELLFNSEGESPMPTLYLRYIK